MITKECDIQVTAIAASRRDSKIRTGRVLRRALAAIEDKGQGGAVPAVGPARRLALLR